MAKRGKQATRELTDRRPRGIALLVFVALALAGWLIYGQALDAPYIYDDLLSVRDNPSILQLWPLFGDAEHRGPLNPASETPTAARPLVNLTFAINYFFTQRSPRGFRLTNLAIHVVNAMLIWALVRRTLLLPRFEGRYVRSAAPLAFVTALLWLVHPLVTETVVYVTQRTELVVACCYLATLYASLRYFIAESTRSRWLWLVLAVLASAAGMASKEVMVTAPVIVLLYDRTFIATTFREALRKSWLLYLGLAATWVIVFALQLGRPRSLSAGFGLGVSLVDYWSTQAKIFLMYLKLAAIPTPLLIHYELALQSLSQNRFYVAVVIVLLVGGGILLWRRHPAGFLIACVFAILAPTHIVPIPTELAAERRMYLPLMAIVALSVVGFYTLAVRFLNRQGDPASAEPWQRRAIGLGVAAGVVVLAYGIVSARRVEVYQYPVALWMEVSQSQPNNHIAHHGLAVALYEAGRLSQAVTEYREAIRLHSKYPEAQYGLGVALLELGRPAEAVEPLRAVLQLKPDALRIRNNLGVALFSIGQFDEAITEFEKVIELNPQMWEAHDNLARALGQAGREEEAKQHFEDAIRLQREQAAASANAALPSP